MDSSVTTNKKSIISLFLGLVAALFLLILTTLVPTANVSSGASSMLLFGFLGITIAIAGIIIGIISIIQAKQAKQKGTMFASIAIAISILSLIILGLFVVGAAIFAIGGAL